MSMYRAGEMAPHDCEQCDCTLFKWNGRPSVSWEDPPSTCKCGHPAARHRFRPWKSDTSKRR